MAAHNNQSLRDTNIVHKIELFSLWRMIFLVGILLTSIFLRQEVLGTQTLMRIYGVMGMTFLLGFVQVVWWETTIKTRFFIPSQLLLDLLLISYLIFLTGINESIFLFLYLLNIILAALVYQTYGALIISFVTGSVYGLIFYINRDLNNANEFYSLMYNELLFLLTALLCGQLMDELKKQKRLLDAQEANIARLEQLNAQLLNNITVGVALADSQDQVRMINQTGRSLLGIHYSDDVVYKYQDIFPTLQDIRNRWTSLTPTERSRYQFQLRSNTQTSRTFSLQLVPLSEPEQLRDHLIFVFQDITDALATEARLEVETRLAAVGQLAAGIAHEIRNPLASISGSLEMLKTSVVTKDEENDKLLTIALRETKRLNRLITDFLQFARPRETKPEIFVLNTVVNEVVEAIQARIRDLVKVDFKISIPTNLRIHGDVERMKQVFFNLFINSVEAAQNREIVVEVRAVQNGNIATIIISDTGPGIPTELSGKVFDPFFTTKQSGTGLGLATVAQIMKSLKGSIRVLTGQGAVFEITVPTEGV